MRKGEKLQWTNMLPWKERIDITWAIILVSPSWSPENSFKEELFSFLSRHKGFEVNLNLNGSEVNLNLQPTKRVVDVEAPRKEEKAWQESRQQS